jgi:hypothetical protein
MLEFVRILTISHSEHLKEIKKHSGTDIEKEIQ